MSLRTWIASTRGRRITKGGVGGEHHSPANTSETGTFLTDNEPAEPNTKKYGGWIAEGLNLRRRREVAVNPSGNDRVRSVLYCLTVLLLLSTSSLFAESRRQSSEDESALLTSPLVDVAANPPVQPSPLLSYGDIWTRPQLTGDWAGYRNEVAENGFTFFGDITQYYQGVTAGGKSQQFRYGGRGDYLIDVDSQKLGLWGGGHLDLRGETRLGQDCNEIDGAVAPSNFAMALPRLNQDVTALTGLQYTQDFSENLSVYLGKLNLLDGTPAAYRRGMRLNYFWNAAMQSNLSRSYLLPSTLGTGFTIRDEDESVFNFYLLDTHYTPDTSGLQDLFTNGVVTYTDYRIRTNWFGLPGHSAAGFLYSTASRTALDTNPYLLLQSFLTGVAPPAVNSAWTVTCRLDQVIYQDAVDPRRNWTIFSDLGLTDGNPNPIRWFANMSLVGGSPIHGREDDSIGIGYYHLGVSNLPILTLHNIGAENGLEFFYNVAVTPWFHVTPDLQILDPAQQNTATALLVGVRARLSF
jgi:porin